MNYDVDLQNRLQMQQLTSQLTHSQQELHVARNEVQNLRNLMLGLGQAFVPEAFAALASGTAGSLVKARVSEMATAEIAGLIARALGEKLAKLTAFNSGLTPEQQARWIQRVIETESTDWVSYPRIAEMQTKIDRAQAAQRAAEEIAREAEARVERLAAQQAHTAGELLRMKQELASLQEVYGAMQRAIPTIVSPAPTMPALASDRSADPSATAPVPAARPGNQNGTVHVPAPVATPRRQNTKEAVAQHLIFLLATRGICERSSLANLLCRELGVSDPGNHLITDGFQIADTAKWIETFTPRTELVGRTTTLLRLAVDGQEFARQELHLEPVPSELDRLFKAHGTNELAHIALILQTRELFRDGTYPEPVASVDLFPTAVALDEGQRYECDLAVLLQNQTLLYIECERNTPKNLSQRADKWAKYFRAAQGQFYIVCPDSKTVTRLVTEINMWKCTHGGKVHLHITSLAQIRDEPARFWVYDRQI